MRIYVAGPYTSEDEATRDARVAAADAVGRALAKMGHVPFVPHKMTWRWEEDDGLSYEDFMRIDVSWLRMCDALFFVGSSNGADAEREIAMAMGLPIYLRLEDVPE